MKLFEYPSRTEWPAILQRPVLDAATLDEKVKAILAEVKKEGDAAVKKYTRQFDGAALETLAVTEAEIEEAAVLVSDELKQAIRQAAANIEAFHARQLSKPEIIETMPGVQCWRKSVGIEKVGLYIPGGSAPLFSTLLMLGIPARLAGCREIVLCSPPAKDGNLHPAILFAARTVGVTKIFKAGGVQAIAAMAYGTGTIPRVYKIFGPGNQYVTCAKQLVQQEGTAIDMPAGPSEVAVYADETSKAAFIAADLLSQAEHGPDSQVLLVGSPRLDVGAVQKEIDSQLSRLPRRDIAARALENSKIVLLRTEEDAADLLNDYAAEHLILSCKDPIAFSERICNAGSIFLGNYSPESVGDYASGTNHTLPTNGHAKAYSGVSVDSFVKKITFQQLTPDGLNNIGRTVEVMAMEEGLEAHANAVRVRREA
ncbi:MAG: histidinol dehydrogenase [Bacteroidetes bacterium]|nr:histidinol dehydrogenase [Bacteroidota bacterium]